MPKKPRVRTHMDIERVKRSERLLKYAQQSFCHIFLLLGKKSSSKKSVSVVSEILRLFVNILTRDEKYSLSVKASVYLNQFKCIYLPTKKYFLNFQLDFLNLHNIWNTLKKKMSLRVYFFVKL